MQKVLVAPLHWGLGHATRCIPVIHALKQAGAEVVVCAGGQPKALLLDHFPELEFITIPGYEIRYPSNGSMAVSMLTQSGKILQQINAEHLLLDAVIRELKLTHVISDNRYGLWSNNAKTAFITHQVHIQAQPILRKLLFTINRSYIRKFDFLWIPDFQSDKSLSGKLSDTTGIDSPYSFIGPLSRFKRSSLNPVKKYDAIAMLSGPEPQRTKLEQILTDKFKNPSKNILIIRGIPGEETLPENKNGISFLNHISDKVLTEILHPDTVFISRPGYSTLMDITALGHSKNFFIPTPGQTEQEYLATHWKKQFHFPFTKQRLFNWEMVFNVVDGTLPDIKNDTNSSLTNAVESFLTVEAGR